MRTKQLQEEADCNLTKTKFFLLKHQSKNEVPGESAAHSRNISFSLDNSFDHKDAVCGSCSFNNQKKNDDFVDCAELQHMQALTNFTNGNSSASGVNQRIFIEGRGIVER
jgi:hypothetical protein